MKYLILIIVLGFFCSLSYAQTNTDGSHPTGQISNGLLTVSFYIPDADNGFYQGTRFDWSGIIYSLKYKGEEYYGKWYNRIDPEIYNNVQVVKPDGTGEVVTGIASSGQGPAEEFLANNMAHGFDEAKPGELFLKIGVGLLRKPDEEPYDRYRDYEIVDGGIWTTEINRDKVIFKQTLVNTGTGYGYIYTKIIRLLPVKPIMKIEHQLQNTGTRSLSGSVYDHNFFVTKNHHTGPDYRIILPYSIQSSRPPSSELATIKDNQLLILKKLDTEDMVALPIEGFDESAEDYKFSVENTRTGTGYSVQGDRPLSRIWLWAIYTNISMEAFINLEAEPGNMESWSYEYTYFTGNN
ncbi:MAG TPA: hypothetical protein VEP89_10535 [Draconibacterium sp.]|nr:hypothetical protein [Draconibacterium sp.]